MLVFNYYILNGILVLSVVIADPDETRSATADYFLSKRKSSAILNSIDSKYEFKSRTGSIKQTADDRKLPIFTESSTTADDPDDQNFVLLKQIDQALVEFTNEFKPPDVIPYDAIPKFDLGLDLAFESDHEKSRLKRSCPSSVGNMGFNSFNFLTFMVMVFNAVANANNNINNNNNNDNDINLNSVSQDSNNVVANSDNMNMVMATILPVPGRKRRSFVGGSGSENNCTIENHAYLHIFQSVEVINDAIMKNAEDDYCSEYIACLEVLRIKDELDLLDVFMLEGESNHLKLGDCQRLYPECAYKNILQ